MFKVGDWIRYKGIAQIIEISNTGYHLSNGYITDGKNGEIKPWQPKAGEYCWFYFIDLSNPILGQFSGYELGGLPTFNNGRNCADSCEPFIGELPSCYKRK